MGRVSPPANPGVTAMRRSNIRAWYRIAVITPLVGAACAELTNPRQSSLTPGASAVYCW